MPLEKFDREAVENNIFKERLELEHPDIDKVHVQLFVKEVNNFAESVFDFCNICKLPHNDMIYKVFDQLNDLIRPQAPDSYHRQQCDKCLKEFVCHNGNQRCPECVINHGELQDV